MKAYENHVSENGEPPSHEKAKELLYVYTHAAIHTMMLTSCSVLHSPVLLSTVRLRPEAWTSSTKRRLSVLVSSHMVGKPNLPLLICCCST